MSVLVAKQAPDFTAPAVLGSGEIVDAFNLYNTINDKYGLIFFYPLDFTFVCPSELIALNNMIGVIEIDGGITVRGDRSEGCAECQLLIGAGEHDAALLIAKEKILRILRRTVTQHWGLRIG